MASALEVKGVHYSYGDPGGVDRPGSVTDAVAGLDLELTQGEFLCVIGPNGSGKSTLLSLCAGLLAPDRGEVLLDGGAAHSMAPKERARRMAVVPQSLASIPSLLVETFVSSGRYAYLGVWRRPGPLDKEAVAKAMGEADLLDVAERSMEQLSGGQRQRVLVARALAQQSEYLLVDEPTNSLDLEHKLHVFAWLKRLACEGRGVMVVTHDLNLASQFADRLMLIRDGRMVASGGPSEVLKRSVLEPIYGPNLHFGELPTAAGSRPYVVPWLQLGDEAR